MKRNESEENCKWELLQSRRDFLEFAAKAGLLAAISPLVLSCAKINHKEHKDEKI